MWFFTKPLVGIWRKVPSAHIPEAKTHDFSSPKWGHAFYYSVLHNGLVLDGHGFQRGISVGDYIIIRKADGNTTRYKVEQIKYCSDPSDMWFGILSFAPRTFTADGVQVGK